MKKNIALLLLIFAILPSYSCYAQWQPEIRLTNDVANSFAPSDKGIAAYGSFIHIVWQDYRDGDAEVYYKRSTDSGISWSSDLRLSPVGNFSGAPTIALYQSTIHVFWFDQRIAPLDIYYVRSTDNGVTWQPEVMITTDLMNSQYPSVSVSGNNIFLCWEDDRDISTKEVYFKRSTNAGVNWSSDIRLTNDTSQTSRISVASFGQNIHVAWISGSVSTEIYYKSSTNGGINWSADQRMTNDPGSSGFPNIAVSGQSVNLFWNDSRDGNIEIYFKRSSDGGASWSSDTRLTNEINNSLNPSAVALGPLLFLVWQDMRLNMYKIYSKFSTNAGVSWSADMLISPEPNNGQTGNPSIDVSDTAVHVIWEDFRYGNPEIYYKKNLLGIPVGVTQTGISTPREFSLSQNYPNPFNPVTNIEFSIPKTGLVKLSIFNAAGRKVTALVNGELSAGRYNYDFDATQLASGIYFYKLEANDFTATKKMVLIK